MPPVLPHPCPPMKHPFHSENVASDSRAPHLSVEETSPAGAKMRSGLPAGRAALVIAHPGHELRVFGWLETARPVVCILTDGSGHTQQSRLPASTRILDAAGATPGSVYGASTDVAIYRAILDHDYDFFTGLADNLAELLVRQQLDYIAGDAIEGYNPGHDVCRMIINTAVATAHRVHQRKISNYDFLLMGHPNDCPAELQDQSYRLKLDDATLERKLAAARAYSEISPDVDSAFRLLGTEAFRTECLRSVRNPLTETRESGTGEIEEPPFYERHGERQVAAGFYRRVLRYRQHMLPLADALRQHAERGGR